MWRSPLQYIMGTISPTSVCLGGIIPFIYTEIRVQKNEDIPFQLDL